MALSLTTINMSIPEIVSLLEERVNNNECDGENCDEKPPFTGCEGCRAARALNEAGELLRKAI